MDLKFQKRVRDLGISDIRAVIKSQGHGKKSLGIVHKARREERLIPGKANSYMKKTGKKIALGRNC